MVAIAASKKTAAFGKVICATAKKLALLCAVYLAHLVSRYSPKTAIAPQTTQLIMPGIIPAEAIA